MLKILQEDKHCPIQVGTCSRLCVFYTLDETTKDGTCLLLQCVNKYLNENSKKTLLEDIGKKG